MKKEIKYSICIFTIIFIVTACGKSGSNQPPAPVVNTGLVNTSHLDYLYTPVTFTTGTKAAGVYIYAEAPDYHTVEAAGEGFTCIDDVARAVLVYTRSDKFSTDTAVQAKAFNLIRFILEMQSDNGYFYNFLYTNGLINKFGSTSVNNANWWSWRALLALTEVAPLVKNMDALLYGQMDAAVNKLVVQIKNELVNLPQTTKIVSGITVPEWLPANSATDQSALLILGLIPYCTVTGDAAIKDYIKKLADGIALMQVGDATHYPYSCFLSWENTWHAYGNIQAYAMLKAGVFLNDVQYTNKALAEIDNFYPWLLQNGYQSSFSLAKDGETFQKLTGKEYEQIAYGITPMVFAAVEAYTITGQDKYADIAGHLAAWFLGANAESTNMFNVSTGRCFDAISGAGSINKNSGAESTIEALFTMQLIEDHPAVKTAFDKYKKP
ncbi:MAG: hypothetical protein ABIO46_01685 [Chitinophagales bacterium]